MAERLQLMADHGMTKEKLEKCVKTEGRVECSSGFGGPRIVDWKGCEDSSEVP